MKKFVLAFLRSMMNVSLLLPEALRRGVSLEEIHEITMIDRWFLQKILNIVKMETVLKTEPMTKEIMRKAKRMALPMWLLANISVNR